MHLLYLVADGLSGRGLIIYCVGMALITGVLAWATYIDHERNERRQGAKR